MNIDANRVIQKLSEQVAAQAQQIAILQVQVEQLKEENTRLKEADNEE